MTASVLTSGWEMDRRPVEAVVISSQVAYGAVGNTAYARVLTEAGHRCVQLPTVLLGTLPHYPVLHGGPIPDEWLAGMLDDLLTLDALGSLRYVLVGYLAHPGQAAIIAEWFGRLQDAVPGVALVVDPAMGDDDVGLYTDPAVAASYGEHLVPLASGLTPNRFELGLLSPSSDAAELLSHPDGWVVVTSASGASPDRVANAIVTAHGSSTQEHELLPTSAKGAGDIFAATIVAALLDGSQLPDAVARAGEAVTRAITALPSNPS